MLKSKVKGQGHQGQKRAITPSAATDGTRLLQITSLSSRRDHSGAAGGDFVRFMFGKTSLALVFCSFYYPYIIKSSLVVAPTIVATC